MVTGNAFFWLVVAMLGVAVWQLLARTVFSPEARDRRRRRRNYGTVESRRHGPTVKLAVKAPPSER